jgi:phytoene dehydrogenase-like protein
MSAFDVVVVGSGPNGMAAAVTMARAGLSVQVVERAATLGGGSRTEERTLPGFRHDVCSAVHPMALASGFFRRFQLERRIELVNPAISFGHPLDDGRAGIAWHDIRRTADGLGVDGPAWLSLFGPLVDRWNEVSQFAHSEIVQVPRHPIATAMLGLRILEQGGPAWNLRFREDAAPAMLSGLFAHTIRSMPSLSTAAAGMVLGVHAHARGWPIPIGGSQAIIDAMADDLRAHGGEVVTGAEVTSLGELPSARAVIFNTTPRALSRIAGDALPSRYRARLERFRYGNAAAKVDFALSDPVPWTNEHLRHAGTVHVGGTRAEIARGEHEITEGRHPASPYVLVAQPGVVDPSRAPAGKHTLWSYTHVPAGSTEDPTEAITAQLERFAPGFRDTILASSSQTAVEMGAYNPNYVDGDIASGEASLQQLISRPTLSSDPWSTPNRGLYLASASTAPGPGVHGLGGYYAARSALRREFGITDFVDLGLDAANEAVPATR